MKTRSIKLLVNLASLVLVIPILFIVGCRRTLSEEDYLEYLSDPKNGLTKTQYLDLMTVNCKYHPNDLFIKRELLDQSQGLASSTTSDSLRHIYDNKLYCELALAIDGMALERYLSRDVNRLNSMLYYLNNDVIHDIHLCNLNHTDSIPASQAIYIRNYGNAKQSTVLLLFDAPSQYERQGFEIICNSQLLGIKQMRFIFSANDIRNLPELKML